MVKKYSARQTDFRSENFKPQRWEFFNDRSGRILDLLLFALLFYILFTRQLDQNSGYERWGIIEQNT